MKSFSYIVTAEDAGQNVHTILRQKMQISRKLLIKQKQIEDGITKNGIHAKTIEIVAVGDIIAINVPDKKGDLLISDIDVSIIYEDSDVVIFDKPANMPTHPSRKQANDTLGNVYARIMTERGEDTLFRPINRLDKDTTGLLLCAKNQLAASKVSGKIDKVYLAVADGEMSVLSGIIDAPIGREIEGERKRVVRWGEAFAKTRFKVLKRGAGKSILSLTIETGRTHQIRVHLAHIGYPLKGDALYGKGKDGDIHLLHCYKLSFISPTSGERIEVIAKLPKEYL